MQAQVEESTSKRELFHLRWDLLPEDRWHNRVRWKAEDYFEDPKVIELCKAVERNDLEAMTRLIDEGADAGAVGKLGMTVLVWALPDDKFERFELLLKRGADPNVIMKTELGTRSEKVSPFVRHDCRFYHGQSISHLVVKFMPRKYFDAVFDHGGDVNLTAPRHDDHANLFDVAIRDSREDFALRLIPLVKDLNSNRDGVDPPLFAAASRGQSKLMFAMIEAGADYTRFHPSKDKPAFTIFHSYASNSRHDKFTEEFCRKYRCPSYSDLRRELIDMRWEKRMRSSDRYNDDEKKYRHQFVQTAKLQAEMRLKRWQLRFGKKTPNVR